MKFAILLLSFFWLGGFASAQTLQVTGQIMGEISPCGCSPGKEKGGIARLSTYLKANQGGLWVDLGNYSSPPTEQGELKNQLWAKAFTDNSLFALLPGPLEFSQGKRGLAKRPLPYLLTNLLSPVANVDRVKTQVDWQFFGFLSPELLSSGRHKTDLLGGVEFFLKEVGKNRSAARHRALLFRGSDQELKEIVQTGLFELVLPANQAVLEEDQKEILVLGTRQYPLPPIKGQGVLEISLDNQKTVRTLWLDKAFEADKAWVPEFKAYDQKGLQGQRLLCNLSPGGRGHSSRHRPCSSLWFVRKGGAGSGPRLHSLPFGGIFKGWLCIERNHAWA